MGALDKNIDTMSGLTGILTTLLGKKGGTESTTTSGGTETKQTMLDVNAMMKQLLEGAGTAGYGKPGLAANLTAGKRAGVYGGKSTELNLNDLLSRITAEASIAGAPTVVTKAPTTTTKSGVGSQSGLMSPGTLGLGALALLAGSSAARKKLGVDGIWDEFFGGDKVASATGGGDTFAELMGGSNNPAADAAFFRNFDSSGGGFQDVGFSAPVYNTAGTWSDISAGAELTDGSFADFASFSDIGTDFFGGWADSGAAIASDGSDLAFNMGMEGADAAGSAGGGIPYLGAGLKVASGDVQGGAESGIGYAVGSYVGGPVGGAIGSAIAEPVFEAASDIVQSVGDIIDDACFITTAICTIQGKPDDCTELTVLRKYRDSWLKSNHPEDIQEYYAVAPAIVQAIQKREDSAVIWNELYRHYLVPAIEAIENGNAALAHTVYRNMVNTAKELANG